MKINLKLSNGKEKKNIENLEVEKGETIENVLKTYDLSGSFIITVNGKKKGKNYELKKDDDVTIFPTVSGG